MFRYTEVTLAYLFSLITILILLLALIFFLILFKKRQNELLLKVKLKEEEAKNLILENEIENQKSIMKERERIAEDIHDDIGGTLSAMRLKTEFMLMNTRDEESKKSLLSMTENLEKTNKSFKEMIWCLHSKNDTIDNFKEYITSNAQSFLENTKVKLVVKDNFPTNGQEFTGLKRRQLILVIKESLNNALKYSGASLVTLSIYGDSNELKISFEDNGKGGAFVKTNGGGLSYMEKRMKSIKGSFYLESNELGTRLVFSTPISSI